MTTTDRFLRLSLEENQLIIKNCNSILIYGQDQDLINLFVSHSIKELGLDLISIDINEIFAFCKSLTLLSGLELYWKKIGLDSRVNCCVFIKRFENLCSKELTDDASKPILLLLFNQLYSLLERKCKIVVSSSNPKDLLPYFTDKLFDSVVKLNLTVNSRFISHFHLVRN